MRRLRWIVVVTLSLAGLVATAWVCLTPPAIRSIDAGSITAVEVRFLPWGETDGVLLGGSSTDPQFVAALVKVLSAAEETRDHKCGSRGVIILRRDFLPPLHLEFLPGHHPDWYEVRYSGRAYRMPRGAFVDAMRRVGVQVPLECQ